MAPGDGDQLAAWLTARYETADTLRQGVRETIVPTAGERDARESLARLPQDVGRVSLAHTLGRGGMGVVRLGEQVALGREVAIKALRPDHKSDEAALELLREAWIAGSIEHPNVVPVHDVGVEPDGSPYIVLKRVEGETWRALMGDAKAVRERFGDADLLAWNLGILMQVLNALRYAHDRGVIHRDLKPDNVMIGAFGEVYLLDWGIAVSLRDDGSGRLPLAAEATELAGSPGYMAPEQLGGQAERLSPQTDLYQIGAILYEMLTGRPPHEGATVAEVVASVRRSSPPEPADAPPQLARICQRAMDPDPAGRFENAEQVRLALQGYLAHRGAVTLAARAEAQRVELVDALARPSGDAEYRQRVYDLFGACRFGFREALSAWRGNEAARAGLRRATEAMVDYELGQGRALAASSLLDELPEPPDALRERVAAALDDDERRRARMSELAKLGRALDMRVGQGARLFMALAIGATVMAVPAFGLIRGSERAYDTHGSMAGWSTAFLGVVLLLGLATRKALLRSVVNQRLFASVVVLLVAQDLLQLGLWIADLSPLQVAYSISFLWFFTASMLAIAVDWRITPIAVGYLFAFFVTVISPSHRFYGMIAGNAILMITAAAVWWPRASSSDDTDDTDDRSDNRSDDRSSANPDDGS